MRISTGPVKIGKELAKYKEKRGIHPVRSREGSSRTKQDAEHVRGFVRDSQRASASYGIHGPMHALAKDVSETFGEPKKFAMYLGIIKNIGLRRAYHIFSKIKQSKNVKTPGKLFVYESTKTMEIVKKPAKILLQKLKEVDLITSNLKKVVLKMKKTMKEANGIGLAANQVGLDMALFVIDEELAREHNAPSVYINPEVKPYSKQTEELEEGCLSIPETWLKITRAKKVKVKTTDENGKKIKFIAKGMLARVLQHEYDHLQGVLITDKK